MYPVRHNQPLKAAPRAGGTLKYPFSTMKVKSTFSVPLSDFKTAACPRPTFAQARERVRSAGHGWRKRTGSKLYFLFALSDDSKSIVVQAYEKS